VWTWHGLYWRVGAGLLALVAAALLAQGLIFIYRLEATDQFDGRPPSSGVALAVAAEMGSTLERQPIENLTRFLRDRAPSDQCVYVAMRDGRRASAGDVAVPAEVKRAAELMLDDTQPVAHASLAVAGPAAFAPIRVYGELHGVASAAPSQTRGVVLALEQVMTWRGVGVLVGLTIGATLLIVGPPRRRLRALEAAALRVADGDLSARAPEDGHDEITQVAQAFNRMSAELASRNQALRTSDRLRRQLLADVSHELKTPLTAMRGFLETLQMGDGQLTGETRRRYLETVTGETLRLDRIVADLVELARFENDIVTLERRVFATGRMFDNIVRRYEQTTAARRVAIRADVTPDADQMFGDPNRLEQVVDNLVGNALRYVPDGGTIGLHARTEVSAVILEVADSGPGIAAEHLPHVFDRFYNADPARAAGGVGSGLGLSIARANVERHGGTIGATSRPGRTVFCVRLPEAAAGTEGPPDQETGARQASTNL
jgi:two-component system, OmpR family, sensor kinase